MGHTAVAETRHIKHGPILADSIRVNADGIVAAVGDGEDYFKRKICAAVGNRLLGNDFSLGVFHKEVKLGIGVLAVRHAHIALNAEHILSGSKALHSLRSTCRKGGVRPERECVLAVIAACSVTPLP